MKRLVSVVAAFSLILAGCGGHKVPNPAHQKNFGVFHGKQLPSKLKATPTILMYDDVTVSRIPSNAQAVACYAVGSFANCGSMAQAFPHAYRVSITPTWSGRANILDVEPGDATPSQAGPWVKADIAAGFKRPGIYASLSTMSAVRASLNAAGLSRSQYFLWDAHWTFTPQLDAGYDATQWYGGNIIDKSQVTKEFLGINNPPPPPPDPYAFYNKKAYAFGKDHASEYNTVKTWDQHKCKLPARRVVCKTSEAHLVLLKGRLWYVAYHPLKNGKPTWNLYARGRRFQGLLHRT